MNTLLKRHGPHTIISSWNKVGKKSTFVIMQFYKKGFWIKYASKYETASTYVFMKVLCEKDQKWKFMVKEIVIFMYVSQFFFFFKNAFFWKENFCTLEIFYCLDERLETLDFSMCSILFAFNYNQNAKALMESFCNEERASRI